LNQCKSLSFCTFSFGHCVVCSSSIYGLQWVSSSVSKLLLAIQCVFIPVTYVQLLFHKYLSFIALNQCKSLSFCTFSFGHCVVCSSSIYGFWLPLWYLQTLLDARHSFDKTNQISADSHMAEHQKSRGRTQEITCQNIEVTICTDSRPYETLRHTMLILLEL
jgi:hypothetical protein